MAFSTRESVELFQLAFLGELGTKLDRSLYALKGGGNLRFFFGSPRASEDLDFDAQRVAAGTLQRKVDRLLEGRSLGLTLGAHGISVASVSRPKQTDTTQRWKIALSIAGAPAHTKIEFSRRGFAGGVEFGSADRTLLGRYGLSPLLSSHYGRQAALGQKIAALVGRSETQARDVFDLHLLLSGSGDIDASAIDPGLRRAAAERARGVAFGDFKSQVLAYLSEERQRDLDDREVWRRIVRRVVDALDTETAR